MVDPSGAYKPVINGIKAQRLIVTDDRSIYVTEPGEDSAQPSRLYLIKPDGTRSVVDTGLKSASGLARSPDHDLLFCAEAASKWVYSYITLPDGSFRDKERYYWLETTDLEGDSGAQDVVVDTLGSLYVATRMGIQICDRSGRVRAILPLPSPCGPIQSLCWGGPMFDTLYATDGQKIFKRKLKIPGYPQWSTPIALKSISAG